MALAATFLEWTSGESAVAGVQRATARYKVTGATSATTPFNIFTASGLPAIGHALGTATLRNIRPKQAGAINARLWFVECEYSNEPGGGDAPGGGQGGDATLYLPEYSISARHYTEGVLVDIHDELVLNPAGQPYNPPPEHSWANPVLRVRLYQNITPAVAAQRVTDYLHHVNDEDFLIWDQFDVKCTEISGEHVLINDMLLMHMTYEFEADERYHWMWRVLQQGPQYLDDEGNLVLARDDFNVATGDEVFLNDDGTFRPYDEEPIIRDWDFLPSADFSLLGVEL